MPQFTSIQAEGAAPLVRPVHDERSSFRAAERSDEVDQIPDILGAKHAFPCRHYLYSICNTICHHPIREIGRSRDSRQVLRAFGKRGRSGTVPTTLGAMAGRTVLNEQLPSSLDRLRRRRNRVWRHRSHQQVEVVDRDAHTNDQYSSTQNPRDSNSPGHVPRLVPSAGYGSNVVQFSSRQSAFRGIGELSFTTVVRI